MSAISGIAFLAASCGGAAIQPLLVDPANVITVTPVPPTPTYQPVAIQFFPTPAPEVLAPVPQSAIHAAASPRSVEQWRELVSTIFPAEAVDAVLTIMLCESGGDPNVTGSAGERGLMQIHPLHFDSTYDPEGNIRAAYRISGGGVWWVPWTCKPGVG